MQGKLVCSQSPSTRLSLNRFSMASLRDLKNCGRMPTGAFANQRLGIPGAVPQTDRSRYPITPRLLGKREISFGATRNCDRLRLVLRAFVPDREGVAAVGDVFDFVVAAVIRLGEIRRRTYNNVSRHFRMDIAEHWNDARLVECEGTLFAFRPGSQIVSGLLIRADRGPKDVVLHGIAVQKFYRCALLNGHDVRRKHQSFLIHDRMVLGCGKSLSRDRSEEH